MVSGTGEKVKGASARRRGHSVRLARLVPPLARRLYRMRGFAKEEVISRWADIVGPELADISIPVRLGFHRGERLEGVLTVRVAPAHATELQHKAPLVLDRVNAFFGYRAAGRLELVQGAIPERRRPTPPPPVPEPDSAAKTRIERLAMPVKDDKLRRLIERWAAEILVRGR